MNLRHLPLRQPRGGFTLIELLVVIAIIAILMGLLFPVASAVRNAARRAQASSDVQQIVTAVRGYYTEYGRYPDASNNADLFSILRAQNDSENPRRIVFIEGKEAQERGEGNFRGGFHENTFYDPWGREYQFAIDDNYDNSVTAAGETVRQGVAAWSQGPRGEGDTDNYIRSWR